MHHHILFHEYQWGKVRRLPIFLRKEDFSKLFWLHWGMYGAWEEIPLDKMRTWKSGHNIKSSVPYSVGLCHLRCHLLFKLLEVIRWSMCHLPAWQHGASCHRRALNYFIVQCRLLVLLGWLLLFFPLSPEILVFVLSQCSMLGSLIVLHFAAFDYIQEPRKLSPFTFIIIQTRSPGVSCMGKLMLIK